MRNFKSFSRAVVLLVMLALALAACGDSTAPAKTQVVATSAPAPALQFGGVPSKPTLDTAPLTIGNPNAPVTLIKYTDFRCPVCKTVADTVEPLIYDQYVATGKIKFTVKTYPVIDLILGDGDSRVGGQALLCAADQQRSWDYHNLAYSNFVGKVSGKLTPAFLKEMAVALKLDTARFNSCLDSGKYGQAMSDEISAARKLKVGGTPTFVLAYGDKTETLPFNDFLNLKFRLDQALGLA